MISGELLHQLQQLDRADKLRVISLLVSDLAAEEEAYLVHGQHYAIWSPYDAPEAAATLLDMLQADAGDDG